MLMAAPRLPLHVNILIASIEKNYNDILLIRPLVKAELNNKKL